MKNQEFFKVVLNGVFVGATVGIIAKFVTDKQNIKYAATGAVVGAIIYVGTYAIKK